MGNYSIEPRQIKKVATTGPEKNAAVHRMGEGRVRAFFGRQTKTPAFL